MLDGNADDPVISAVAFVPEAVAVAEIPDVAALPVVKDTWDEPIPVLVGTVIAVPFPVGAVVGALPEMIELEPITEDPTPVLVGGVVSVPFPAVVDVGVLADPVGVLKISVEVGTLPDPKMLERMLPRPVEIAVDEVAAGSVGVGVTMTPLDEGMMLAITEERILDETGAVVDAAAEVSTPVLGRVIPVVEGRRLLMSEEIRSGVDEAAAEDPTEVPGPEIPAVDVGAEETIVDVGSRALVTPDRRLLTPPRMPVLLDEEAGAVVAAVPEPEIPDVMLSDVELELPVELAAALDEVKTPPGANVIPLPVEVAAEDDVVSGSVVDEVVGRIIIEGIPPEVAADDGSRMLETTDASGLLVLSLELELELDVAAEVSGPTTVVSETMTVVTPSVLGELLEDVVGKMLSKIFPDPVDAADPELDPLPCSLVSPLNNSENDRLVD